MILTTLQQEFRINVGRINKVLIWRDLLVDQRLVDGGRTHRLVDGGLGGVDMRQ